jgi:hypothetical protein
MKRLFIGVVLALMAGLSPAEAQTNGLLREVYDGISGTAVADLTNNAAFPDNPTSTNFYRPVSTSCT